MKAMTDILFNMHSTDNDLWYSESNHSAYFQGANGMDIQDFDTIKDLVDNKYIACKENGRCVLLKKGQNHLRKHLGVHFKNES